MGPSIPVDVDKLINNISTKLPNKIVGFENKPELNLWNMQVIMRPHPIPATRNHIQKMRVAWLMSGSTGLLNYVEPLLKKETKAQRDRFETFRKIILLIK